MKSWLKGGLIGVVIITILSIPALICFIQCSFSGEGEGCIPCAILSLPIFFGCFIIYPLYFIVLSLVKVYNHIPGITLFSNLVFILISLSGYFLFGALIGWIIGKIKSKNN